MIDEWIKSRPRRRAIISDIDDTICKSFDRPIQPACDFLARLDPAIEVHYVTSRPEESREQTESFIDHHHLPGRNNLHFCPNWKPSNKHKAEVVKSLATEFEVIASIGDADEDQKAALDAGVTFVRVTDEPPDLIWARITRLL